MAELPHTLKVAAQAGPAALMSSALAEAIRLLRAKVHGTPYARVLDKQFTNSSTVTLNGTSGQWTDFPSSEYKNDGKYDYELHSIWPITTTGSSAWRLQIEDVTLQEKFFGTPQAIRVTQIIDSNRRPTGVGFVKHRIDPNGAFFPRAQSVGSADVVELTLKGVWIVEE